MLACKKSPISSRQRLHSSFTYRADAVAGESSWYPCVPGFTDHLSSLFAPATVLPDPRENKVNLETTLGAMSKRAQLAHNVIDRPSNHSIEPIRPYSVKHSNPNQRLFHGIIGISAPDLTNDTHTL